MTAKILKFERPQAPHWCFEHGEHQAQTCPCCELGEVLADAFEQGLTSTKEPQHDLPLQGLGYR